MDKNSYFIRNGSWWFTMATTGSVFNRDVVAEEFVWKIENFSLDEYVYRTPEFKFQSETWCLVVVPSTSDGYMLLGIVRITSGLPIAVEFTLALKTSYGHKICERGGTEFCDEWKDVVTYRMITLSEFKRRQPELLSSFGCLTLIITMKRDDFVEPAGRLHFFRSKYIPVNSSAPVSHETLPVATTSDAVKNENASGEFEWKIENFSLTEDPHLSPEFTLESETWKFGGASKLSEGYIDLNVARISPGSPILVEFTFSLQTSDGQKCFERVETEIFHEWKRSCWYRWMKISEFEERLSETLSSGCLTVIITVKTVEFVKPATVSASTVSSSRCNCLRSDKIAVDKKYLDKPVKCPVCAEVLSLQSWFNHECSMETGKGECGTEFQPKNSICQDVKQEISSEENCDVVLRAEGQESSSQENIATDQPPATASTSGDENKGKKKSKFEGIDIYYEILAA